MTILAWLQIYLDFVCSPPSLSIAAVVIGWICLEEFRSRRLTSTSKHSSIPGCVRLKLTGRSNLDDQYDHEQIDSTNEGLPRIKALYTYPIKSCRGIELDESEVTATGLKYDRVFTFAQLEPRSNGNAVEASLSHTDEKREGWKQQWRLITQREYPRLALVETELWIPRPKDQDETVIEPLQRRDSDQGREDVPRHAPSLKPPFSTETLTTVSWAANGGCLILRFPFEPDFNPFGLRTETITLRLPLSPTSQRAAEKQHTTESVTVWKDNPQAINITNEIEPSDLAKLRRFLRISNPLALFMVDQNHMRNISRSLPKDKPNESYSVGFADAFPLHVVSLSSVRAQDYELPTSSRVKGSLDARRFRGNIYVFGSPAYDEDTWKRIAMGRCEEPRSRADGEDEVTVSTHAGYHVACRTARCKLPNVDQQTGVRDVNEPLSTLMRTRKVDRGAYPHPVLGVQMIPLFKQGIIRVGDEIEVLERGEHVYEKMFA